jgi:proton-dependent oligopeptide transporter, POT family
MAEAKPPSKLTQVFWFLNSIEMWERLSFYNLRVMAPIYVMQADDPGGLHLTATQKGTIYAWWAVFQSLLPIVTGGLADRFGYKRTLGFALSLMLMGYLMIAFLRDLSFISNYWAFFLGIMTLATGTAFFKPGIQGSLANILTKENSSVGWGVFYWVVNVGALVGHFLPTFFLIYSVALPGPLHGEAHSREAWRNVFLASAAFTCLNLVTLLWLKDVPSGASKTESLGGVLKRTMINIFEPRLLAWIAIMSCFWLMMYQLWDLQPNFITDWLDSKALVEQLRWLPNRAFEMLVAETPRGPMLRQQTLLSLNSIFIILGVIPMAWLTRRMRTLSAMLIGMCMATAGILIAGWTMSGYVLIAGILCFSLGEMLTGPKKSEYLGLIAPPGKKGLYLGYVNIPVGLGVYVGSTMAGFVYGNYGEKAVLALRFLAEKTAFGQGKGWDGSVATLEKTLGVARPEAMAKLVAITGMDQAQATRVLWETYSPHLHVWLPFATIGIIAAAALFLFGRAARKWADMDA